MYKSRVKHSLDKCASFKAFKLQNVSSEVNIKLGNILFEQILISDKAS